MTSVSLSMDVDGSGACQAGLDPAHSDDYEGQGGCKMGWTRSRPLLNHVKAVSGFGPGVAELKLPTPRTRMDVSQMGKSSVPATIGSRLSQPGPRTHQCE